MKLMIISTSKSVLSEVFIAKNKRKKNKRGKKEKKIKDEKYSYT